MFYRWKYSGLIVVPTVMLLIVGGWFYYTSSLEFFDPWSCQTIENYLLDKDVPDDITPHNDLTEEQHLKLHAIYDECRSMDTFQGWTPHE